MLKKSKSSKLTLSDFADTQVKLGSLFGVPPRLYLKVFYALFLLLGLFFLLLYPGIKNYGSRVTFDSLPQRTSVYIDGKRVGSTPLTLFVPAGEHRISYSKPFFHHHEQQVSIKGRRFFSLFFPKKLFIQPQLSLIDQESLLKYAFSEASFAYSTTYNPRFPREPFLLHALDDLLNADVEINKQLLLRWAADAWSIIGDQPSLEEVMQIWRTLAALDYPINAQLMTGILFDMTNPQLADIVRYQQQERTGSIPSFDADLTSLPNLNLLNLSFTYQPSASFLMGRPNSELLGEFASPVTLDSFYYMEQLVSQAQFNRIINGIPNPDDQRDLQVDRFDGQRANQAVSYVSLEAAQLFIHQLNLELTRSNQPWRARLPYESEWEFLAQNRLINTRNYEWMHEPYYPLKNLLFANRPSVYTEFLPLLQSVRGFDAQNERTNQQQTYLRAAQEPTWLSPFISFRVVLEPR